MLYEPYLLQCLSLKNRIVMAPMTRCRCNGNTPNALMADYYQQRAGVGLIITEGVSPSINGLGYARMPGISTPEQISAWRTITQATHQQDSKIFMQLMHTGRVSHPFNMSPQARILAPSAIAAAGDMYTDAAGLQPLPTPHAMTLEEIEQTIAEFKQGALNAIEAGCDGIELHAANGYLLEQFLRPNSNQRNDQYGGNIQQRSRFILEVSRACIDAIGKNKVGIRLSPFGVFNDMPDYPEMLADYSWLAEQLNQLGLAYIHLVDHSAMGAPAVPPAIKQQIRQRFSGCLILSGGYNAQRAEQDLQQQQADLIAVGRPLIANPDLITRWQNDLPLATPDASTFYTPGPKGYIDYPCHEQSS